MIARPMARCSGNDPALTQDGLRSWPKGFADVDQSKNHRNLSRPSWRTFILVLEWRSQRESSIAMVEETICSSTISESPADNFISTCAPCHAPSQWPPNFSGIPPVLVKNDQD
ncbi:hypothetical protein BDQ12DRAFT_672523 [Crucibulum laeve]|uniref:Uncharacterized protein n=1 Tax=Crucibulum laeve TaxID=68775 RepID=A0A5C3MII7_9AGAR|nr:hypothetical protein BDQ12DRAFT_672523 [Crucibulum laeve]